MPRRGLYRCPVCEAEMLIPHWRGSVFVNARDGAERGSTLSSAPNTKGGAAFAIGIALIAVLVFAVKFFFGGGER